MLEELLPVPRPPEAEPYQAPKPGCTIQVIGAGLPRSGTNSFCAAVARLLNGPAYHCGIQAYTSLNERHALTWITIMKILASNPSTQERTEALSLMRTELEGYVVTADPPLSILLPELQELYPHAKVVCSLREKDSCAPAMLHIVRFTNIPFLGFCFTFVRSLQWFSTMAAGIRELWLERIGVEIVDLKTAEETWERYMAFLRQTVPKERLFFVPHDAGWEPLCEVLEVEAPGVEYPNLLDRKGFEATFKTWILQGLGMWALIAGSAVLAVGLGWLSGGEL